MSGASQDQSPKDAAEGGGAAREVEDLAARYLDLWQDQVSALAADPEFAEAWRKLVESFGLQVGTWQNAGLPSAGGLPDPMAAMQAMMAGMRPGAVAGDANARDGRQGDDDARQGTETGERDGAAAGAASAAAASGGGGADLEQLAARLERIEQRLAALEAKPSAKGGGARKRNRKPGS